MSDRKVTRVSDEIVIDSADVERAAELALRRHGADPREESAERLDADETIIIPPEE